MVQVPILDVPCIRASRFSRTTSRPPMPENAFPKLVVSAVTLCEIIHAYLIYHRLLASLNIQDFGLDGVGGNHLVHLHFSLLADSVDTV